jgi:hypothetical protein
MATSFGAILEPTLVAIKTFTSGLVCVVDDRIETKIRFFILCYIYIGRFVMFSVITNIYNKKTKGPPLMELFTATGKIEKVFDK